jgi:hypothetical protein
MEVRMSTTLLRAVSAGALLAAMVTLAAQQGFAQQRQTAGGSVNSNRPTATDRDTGLDRAQDRNHQSTRTNTNANGVNAADRQTGFDRATDRMNQQGLDNNRVGTAKTGGPAGGGKGRK